MALLGIKELVMPQAMVEIQAVATLRSGAAVGEEQAEKKES